MRTIVIEWESMNSGALYVAHFPEPFPMSDADYRAFEAVFASWQRRYWEGVGETRVEETKGPQALVRALRGLGYEVSSRGTVPPGV